MPDEEASTHKAVPFVRMIWSSHGMRDELEDELNPAW